MKLVELYVEGMRVLFSLQPCLQVLRIHAFSTTSSNKVRRVRAAMKTDLAMCPDRQIDGVSGRGQKAEKCQKSSTSLNTNKTQHG